MGDKEAAGDDTVERVQAGGEGKQAGEGAPVADASRRRRAREGEGRGDRDSPIQIQAMGVGGGASGGVVRLGFGFVGGYGEVGGGRLGLRPDGPACWAEAQWGLSLLPFFVCLFSVFFYYFFLSCLNHFKPFSHFIKMCLLHHNYLCNIWQPPNTIVSIFENFYCRH